jgi:hypothetical protein
MFKTTEKTVMTCDRQQAKILLNAARYVFDLNSNIEACPPKDKSLAFWSDRCSISADEMFNACTDFECQRICAGMADYNPDSEIRALELSWKNFLEVVLPKQE